MREAVFEDDDEGRTGTVQTEQLGASSSDKTTQQDLTDGQSVASGDRELGGGRVCCRTAQPQEESKEGSTRYVDWSINTYVSASRGAR